MSNESFRPQTEEELVLALRSLYRSYGYRRYKMSKFEEYDLYARNKDFLVSDNIITFTDTNGKLMALKPDVTLSIVRNSRDDAPSVQKLCYNENVYRVSERSRSFREIMQSGLECIGKIDDYCICEVLLLAAKSLLCISDRCVLDISHLDIISQAVDRLGVKGDYAQKILACIGKKNMHELASLCAEAGADPEKSALLKEIVSVDGPADDVIPRLRKMDCLPSAVDQLQAVAECFRTYGLYDMLHIDFSVVNDMSYYNGIVFKGFIDGIPSGVLSGGRYDRLMEKMGRSSKAIGFAVYLDLLEQLYEAAGLYGADTVLLYGDEDAACAVSAAVKALTDEGCSVSAQRTLPEKLRCRRVLKLNGNEVKPLD